MSDGATRGTQIAALEAQRNEQQVRAEGALDGERRAALARIVMVAMFGTISQLGGELNPTMTYVGASYTLFSILTLLIVRRRHATISGSMWKPLAVTLVDFTFITTVALIDTSANGYSAGQHAIAAAILISFSIARMTIWHVVASLALAQASFLVVTSQATSPDSQTTIFVCGGLVVVGVMTGLSQRAVVRMFAGLRQRDNLTRFLPRQVADRVIAAGPGALAPVEREVTVLFSDIRGFTSLSEGLSPREVLRMLDDYFGRMSAVVKGHDGVVGKFLGDGMLAFWGVPDRLDDHAQRAVRAARDMRRVLAELNAHRAVSGLAPLKVGIGIHTGNVAAGMLGQLQAEYTVIGDAVNVASRVEGLTKEHGVDLLISETTWAELPEPRRGERVGNAEIRGRKAPIVLYTIPPESTAETADAR
ncbi:MAG: adenylate/guanylate cyclase domain-containing protein [Kofleriaceae bacterium]